jgi:hypothetical protein
MTCSICQRNVLKQFVREDMILCYVCVKIYDSAKNKKLS